MGVSLSAWPIHFDQPQNAVLVTELLKVGVIVREWECRMTLLMCSFIKNVVRRLMISKEGKQMRERGRELGEKIRKSAAERGNSSVELDSYIAHTTR
ncbi:Zeatin O-glucosyltransferase [Euphorbia peplus]|nr:Zeatin O-glucosyltransferase [Euphorbia peplus]